MAERLTREELYAWSEREVELPTLSATLGIRKVLVRRIGAAEYLSLLPPDPPGAETWPDPSLPGLTPEQRDEVAALRRIREQEYLNGLSEEAREALQEALRAIPAKVVACAALDPVLTPAEARRLGNDCLILAGAILDFSGLGSPAVTEAPPS